MVKYILLGGTIHKAADGGKAFCDELIKNIAHRPVKILDCLFAREKESWNERFFHDTKFFAKNIEHFEIEMAKPETFVERLKKCDVLYIPGGVPLLLKQQLEPLAGWLNELEGKVIVGSSGSADALCTYYGVGKTMKIGEGMGLLPIKFIPHWKSAEYEKGISIDWDALLEALSSYKESLDIVTLGDGEFFISSS